MLLTITMTGSAEAPASDLGYLLHKHPDRYQRFDVSAGIAHVCYPESTGTRCTAALLLEVDPIALVRGRGRKHRTGFALGQYVNDRPYAGSSLFAVAIGQVFGTAMRGRCDARPELAARPVQLELEVPVLPCRGGSDLADRLFAPLGWTVDAAALPLEPTRPQWGDSSYVRLRLSGTVRLADALNHLYVLLPVLDDAKHYWVSTEEVDKLVRAGTGWLAGHPERELIARRYLAHQRSLAHDACDRLAEVDDTPAAELDTADTPPQITERAPTPLAEQRIGAVVAALRASGATTVIDLGCGGGRLLEAMLADPAFAQLAGADVSTRALERAASRLHLEQMGERERARVTLFQAALTYRDARIAGYDAAVLMEVVEHVDPPRLPALARTVFGAGTAGTVLVTTPNAEYNVRYPLLPTGAFRHSDHRFEWTRAEFRQWTREVADRYGYTVRIVPVGGEDPDVGAPSQLAVFTRTAGAAPFGTGTPCVENDTESVDGGRAHE